MNRLLTLDEFVTEESLVGSDLWIGTQYEKYVIAQRFKMRRAEVSKSMYLYSVDATHFNNMVTSQETFVSVRVKYLEAVIKQIQSRDSHLRDNERLGACIKARGWCEKMMKELKE